MHTHSGNFKFRTLVTDRAQDYAKAATGNKKGAKKKIVEDIIKEIKSSIPSGRFLYKGSIESNSWVEVTDHEAINAQVVSALEIMATNMRTNANTQATPPTEKITGNGDLITDKKVNNSKAIRRLTKEDQRMLERLMKQGTCCLMIDSVPTTVRLEDLRLKNSMLYVTALDIDDGNDSWEMDVKALIHAATEAEELGFYEVECYIGKERAKNGSYMIKVRWTTGEETLEPLKQVKEDDPVGLALWARRTGLEKQKSFHWIKKVLEKANSKKVYVAISRSKSAAGGYIVHFKDSIGEEYFVPVDEVKETDPMGLALFVRKEGLEKQSSFRWVTNILAKEGAPVKNVSEKRCATSIGKSPTDGDVGDLGQGAKQVPEIKLETQKKNNLPGQSVDKSKHGTDQSRATEFEMQRMNELSKTSADDSKRAAIQARVTIVNSQRKNDPPITSTGGVKKAAKLPQGKNHLSSLLTDDVKRAAKRPLESKEFPQAVKKQKNVDLASADISELNITPKQAYNSKTQDGSILSATNKSENAGANVVDQKRNEQVQNTSRQSSHVSKREQSKCDRMSMAASFSSRPPSKSLGNPSKIDAPTYTGEESHPSEEALETSQRYRFCWV